ncbi:MAG: hypothetical protein DRI46_10040 [Chloroflexi bacterium]|nr:MAG: hypothetical protein DRI46_10040 [Chloroflexota bacterium]
MATTNIVFQVDTDHLQRFINGIAAHYGYQQESVDGAPNPETKAQYGKRKIRQEWVRRIQRQERLAAEAAIEATVPIDVT